MTDPNPAMIKAWSDFNALSVLDRAWLVLIDGRPLAEMIEPLGLNIGDRLLLWQDDDDFFVEGILRFDPPGAPSSDKEPAWCLQVDWSTLVGAP